MSLAECLWECTVSLRKRRWWAALDGRGEFPQYTLSDYERMLQTEEGVGILKAIFSNCLFWPHSELWSGWNVDSITYKRWREIYTDLMSRKGARTVAPTVRKKPRVEQKTLDAYF